MTEDWIPVKSHSEMRVDLLVKVLCAECGVWSMVLIAGAPFQKQHKHKRDLCHDINYPIRSLTHCKCEYVTSIEMCVSQRDFHNDSLFRLADRHLREEVVAEERVMAGSTRR